MAKMNFYKIRAFFIKIMLLGVVAVLIFTLGFAVYFSLIARKIDNRMSELKSTKPTQFYSVYPPFKINQKFADYELKEFLRSLGYIEKNVNDELSVSEYTIERKEEVILTLYRAEFIAPGYNMPKMMAKIFFEPSDGFLHLKKIELFDTHDNVEIFENIPVRLGLFYAGRLRTQEFVPLSKIPAVTRLAVIAIEDLHFLEHHGFSFRGFLRAMLTNLKAKRFVQGGSTITQQLMKNLFFSHEKEIRRKIKEALFALVTELRHSKENILEAYLNEVYLGQCGNREIHGFSEGALYYFQKTIGKLTLAQSATLAAMIQAPNVYNPKNYSTKLLKRRNLVLEKMLLNDFITKEEYETAIKEQIGIDIKDKNLEDTYYAIDYIASNLPESVKSKLSSRSFMVFSSINNYLQEVASRAIRQNLIRLKRDFSHISENEKKGYMVESALVAIDAINCSVLALSGGRSYKDTQYNRVKSAFRQPGSLFKPFVYLSAFLTKNYTPLSTIEDSPFTWEYENQSWIPRNYDKKFRGPISLREALENSINVPTAKLAKEIGIEQIVSVIKDAGIKSNLPSLPSISLGSAEVTPMELAIAFTTLSNLGRYCEPRSYLNIFDDNGNLVEKNDPSFITKFPEAPVFQTVNILKGVFTHGTAKRANFAASNFAGKTGTTNEYNDAWFVGFSPQILVLVWVGYDEKIKLGLSGTGAALPTWINFINHSHPFYSDNDFVPPLDLTPVVIDRISGKIAGSGCKDVVTEYFMKGTEPTEKCEIH